MNTVRGESFRLSTRAYAARLDLVKPLRPDDPRAVAICPWLSPSPGYQRLVRGEPMRARFRNSFSAPEALTPNATTPIHYTMPDVNHTFLRGHRIVVQVQSSWFPLADKSAVVRKHRERPAVWIHQDCAACLSSARSRFVIGTAGIEEGASPN